MNCCGHIIKLEEPDFGFVAVVGACRPCAECGVLRRPVYNILKCPYCKKSGIYGIHWIHLGTDHVTCYNSIETMIDAGILGQGKPFEYPQLRSYREWPE